MSQYVRVPGPPQKIVSNKINLMILSLCHLISDNIGAIVGGVFGGVAVLAVIAVIVLMITLLCIPRNTKVAHEDDEKV